MGNPFHLRQIPIFEPTRSLFPDGSTDVLDVMKVNYVRWTYLMNAYYCGGGNIGEAFGTSSKQEYRVKIIETETLSAARYLSRPLDNTICSKWWCVETRVCCLKKNRIHRRVLCTDQQWRSKKYQCVHAGESIGRSYSLWHYQQSLLMSTIVQEGMIPPPGKTPPP